MSRTFVLVGLVAVILLAPFALAGPETEDDITTVTISESGGAPFNGDIAVDPFDPDHWLYTDCGGGPEHELEVMESLDRGENWTEVAALFAGGGGECSIVFNEFVEDLVALVIEEGGDIDVAISTNGGGSWSKNVDRVLNGNLNAATGVWADEDTLTVYGYNSNNGNHLAATSNDTGVNFDADRVLWSVDSTNDGHAGLFRENWQRLGGQESRVRFLSEAGTAVSNDGGVSWSSLDTTPLANLATDCGYSSHDEVAWGYIGNDRWFAVAFESSEVVDTCLAFTSDGGSNWDVRGKFDKDNRVDGAGVTGNAAWGYVHESSGTPKDITLVWSEDQGSTWTNVTMANASSTCGGNDCEIHDFEVTSGAYILAFFENTNDDKFASFTEFTTLAEPEVVGPEPVDFATGFSDAVTALGFRSERSQMFFALALVGITTVGTGVGLKFMGSSRMKNWTIVGAAMGVGAFTVLVFFLEFWMYLIALVVGGAIVMGPTTFLNTLSELRDEAERAVGGGRPDGGEVVRQEGAPGMVDVGEAEMVDVGETELVETTAQVDLGEGTELVDVGEAEDVEV